MGSRLRNTKVSIREKWPLSGFKHCQHLLPSPQPNQTSSVLRRMDTLRTLTNVTNTMTAMTEFQRSVSAQMVLFLIHIQERESLAITISTYTVDTALLSSHQRAQVTCVHVSMVSTLTQTHLFVIFSTLVLMVRPRNTLVPQDSGSMNTAEFATGLRQLTDKTARLKLMLLGHPTDSSAHQMPQLMSLVNSTHILSMLMPMTVQNSMSA